MDARERFSRIMSYQPVDRLPVIAFEPYEKTALERWHKEGLPDDKSVEDILGMSRLIKVPAYLGPRPRFDHQILYEDNECIIEIDTTYGATVKKMKIAPSMYYGYIDHQVKTMDDWRKLKYRYENTMTQRVPAGFDEIVESLNSSGDPIKLEIFPHFFRLGFYLMGMENFLLAFYDQPDLIHEMFSFWTEFTIAMIEPFLSKVKIDILVLMEDLAYNNNPHLSPDTYREFWLPYQDILVGTAKKNNIENICIWTAGDIDVMIPMLIDHGINCLWPVERCSENMDPNVLRNKYGRELKMSGGIPHRCLTLGTDAIDREIEKLMPLIQEGGFIPALDDMVSPEVSWEKYKYYIKKLQSIRL